MTKTASNNVTELLTVLLLLSLIVAITFPKVSESIRQKDFEIFAYQKLVKEGYKKIEFVKNTEFNDCVNPKSHIIRYKAYIKNKQVKGFLCGEVQTFWSIKKETGL